MHMSSRLFAVLMISFLWTTGLAQAAVVPRPNPPSDDDPLPPPQPLTITDGCGSNFTPWLIELPRHQLRASQIVFLATAVGEEREAGQRCAKFVVDHAWLGPLSTGDDVRVTLDPQSAQQAALVSGKKYVIRANCLPRVSSPNSKELPCPAFGLRAYEQRGFIKFLDAGSPPVTRRELVGLLQRAQAGLECRPELSAWLEATNFRDTDDWTPENRSLMSAILWDLRNWLLVDSKEECSANADLLATVLRFLEVHDLATDDALQAWATLSAEVGSGRRRYPPCSSQPCKGTWHGSR